MTEAEATTKWCPHAKNRDGGNRFTSTRGDAGCLDQNCMCVASRCMSWRWAYVGGKLTDSGHCGLADDAPP
jgi:hypothetical protein